jgi:flavin-dependent dehydrogenase
MPDRHLRKVAYFEHFQDVRRLEGRYEGCPTIAMADEGWFWIIPLNERMTSVGLVLDPDVARSIDVPARRLLRWGIERCPLMRQRLRDAVGPEDNLVRADFSYRCDPMAGPGYFLLGDAAMFIDPIFSTGVSIGMAAAQGAVQAILDIRQSRRRPSAARHRYIRLMRGLCAPLLRLIHHYYDHAFRELFLNGRGPLRLHQAVMAVLAGNVLPRVAPAVAWRLEVFNQVVRLQRRFALAPRRRRFSLLRSPVDAVPGLASIRLKAGRMDTPVSLAG